MVWAIAGSTMAATKAAAVRIFHVIGSVSSLIFSAVQADYSAVPLASRIIDAIV
jgi:hypothetical protein